MQRQAATLLLSLAMFAGLVTCGSGSNSGTIAGTGAGGGATGTPGVNGPNLPAVPYDYVAYAVTNLPAHYSNPLQGPPQGNGPSVAGADNTPINNPITNSGATLGRVLFYDKRLSANDSVSCASCHQQSHGFADPGRLSTGFQGGNTARHAMGLTNAKYYARGRFFWDERAATLEDQVLQPIQNSVEMGMTLPQLETKLSGLTYYPPLFQAAFGSTTVTQDRVAKALAQFVRSLVSYQSKYDQAFKVAPGNPPNFAAVFTPQELQGLQLFGPPGGPPGGIGRTLNCNQCHGTAAQIAANTENNGLDATVTDVGAGGGRFKVPSLRNVAARAPFMHDGRFANLDAVIEHYNSGVQDSPNLSPRLRAGGPTGPPQRLNLTAEEKAALLALLNTLTDNTFLSDPKFSNPF